MSNIVLAIFLGGEIYFSLKSSKKKFESLKGFASVIQDMAEVKTMKRVWNVSTLENEESPDANALKAQDNFLCNCMQLPLAGTN